MSRYVYIVQVATDAGDAFYAYGREASAKKHVREIEREAEREDDPELRARSWPERVRSKYDGD